MENVPIICLMLKAPQKGRVKTRLAKKVGNTTALEIYQRLVEHQLRQLPRRWPKQIHYTPRSALAKMEAWLGKGYHYIPQCNGDLGKRMVHAMKDAFKNNASSVMFLGGDCPYITKTVLEEAKAALERVDIILGPAKDGGYYLIGLRRVEPKLFCNIDWGEAQVFSQTIQRIQSLGLKYQKLKLLEDVDDLQTWDRACRTVFS